MKPEIQAREVSLEVLITNAIQLPGVKVDRQKFLLETFGKRTDVDLQEVLAVGPVEAKCARETLSQIAGKLIAVETGKSSIASFGMGLPGGLAMGVTIPADAVQFFGMSLRLAQELSYLYGAQDLWKEGEVDEEAVKGQLVLYCGVMFGVTGASAGVRLLSSRVAGTLGQKLAQQALTKTVWYPVVKQIGKAVGVKITKSTVAKGVTKAVPVIGGVISGGLTLASMLPMAKRLAETMDQAAFAYTEEEIAADYETLRTVLKGEEEKIETAPTAQKHRMEDVTIGIRSMGAGVTGLLTKAKQAVPKKKPADQNSVADDVFAKIEKLQKLQKQGAITQEEYDKKKTELLKKI